MEDIFFELIQVALGTRECLSRVPNEQEWKELSALCQKQAISGTVFHALDGLSKYGQKPTLIVLYEWIGYANQIEARNRLTTDVCKQLCDELDRDGIRACILKGQANHAYYPEKMGNMRTCGDIDIWMRPKDRGVKHKVKWILDYLEKRNTIESLCYLHAEVKPRHDVPIEVHFRPTFLNEPIHNGRLQRLFGNMEDCTEAKEIDGVTLPVLKWEYDVIFQLCHIYRHLLDEGVGLRQVIDYYYLLKYDERNNKKDIIHHVERLGMKRFAGALMYVLQEVLAMPEEYLLCPASEIDGKFLLSEILLAGNFGHSDPRLSQLHFEKGKTSFQVKRAWRRIKRNSRFLMSYPSEVIWEPVARYEHFCWRKLKMWRV